VFFVFLSSFLISFSEAQVCSGAGYDMSSVSVDLTTYSGGYYWFVHPCGALTNDAACTNANPGVSICQQTSNNVSNPTNTGYVAGYWSAANATWAALPNNQGVQYSIEDGAACGNFDRETTVQFICNETATTPWLKSVTELDICYYTINIQTKAACTQSTAVDPSQPGTTFFDSTCGSSVWDLTAIENAGDLVFNTTTGGPPAGSEYNYYLRLCGTVQTTACSSVQPTSLCQAYNTTYTPYSLGYFNNSLSFLYTTVSTTELTISLQDGTSCGSVANRELTLNIICDGTNPPQFTNLVQVHVCYYTATIHGVCSLHNSTSSASSTGSSVSSTGSSVSSTGSSVSSIVSPVSSTGSSLTSTAKANSAAGTSSVLLSTMMLLVVAFFAL